MRGRLTITMKFFVVLAVLTPLIVAVALTGVAGLTSMRSAFDEVFAGNIHVSRVSTTLGTNLSAAEEAALQLAGATDSRERYSLNVTLDQALYRPSTQAFGSCRPCTLTTRGRNAF